MHSAFASRKVQLPKLREVDGAIRWTCRRGAAPAIGQALAIAATTLAINMTASQAHTTVAVVRREGTQRGLRVRDVSLRQDPSGEIGRQERPRDRSCRMRRGTASALPIVRAAGKGAVRRWLVVPRVVQSLNTVMKMP